MRKRITPDRAEGLPSGTGPWLDVAQLAVVEVTSEDPSYPIESALVPGAEPGWRAAAAGRQSIRLLFDEPLTISRIHLEFQERDHPRTQEFALRWRAANGADYVEIVRQQYNFSPGGSSQEIEDYRLNLLQAVALELTIVPEVSGGPARASLRRLLLE